MCDLILKKISYAINFIQFKVGEFLFPAFESIFRMSENKDPKIKQYFDRAVNNLESKNLGVALLNLNLVLSLKPNHFLARVYRGRIYIHERRYRQAAEDYIRANQISRYRFIHYDLYREYFSSLDKGAGYVSSSLIQNFNQAFEMLEQGKSGLLNKQETGPVSESNSDQLSPAVDETKEPDLVKDLIFTPREQSKFRDLRPITRQEIRKTDWDQLIKDLISKTEEK
ncbi:MAG: hypothetical protein ACE5G9_13925 [Nitrospinales bacterium]